MTVTKQMKVALVCASAISLAGCVVEGGGDYVCEKDGLFYKARPMRYVDSGKIDRFETEDANGVAFVIDRRNSHLFKCKPDQPQ